MIRNMICADVVTGKSVLLLIDIINSELLQNNNKIQYEKLFYFTLNAFVRSFFFLRFQLSMNDGQIIRHFVFLIGHL